MKKSAGILFAVSSLPSKYGIGCFSKEAYRFVDWLKEAGQTYWQILPMGPTGYGDSPYQSFSTFSGNPYYIDLEALIQDGLLTRDECRKIDFGDDPESVDYEKLYNGRYILLRKAFERSDVSNQSSYCSFMQDNKEWIEDYCLFMAIKDHFNGKAWYEWPEDIRSRNEQALDHYQQILRDEIEFHKYMQYMFFRQWNKLRTYANAQGVHIIGDIPIYVALDSSDVWVHPELFQLDEERNPVAVAGCPPDGFSATGQLWGNPLYDWQYHRSTGYAWWISRMKHCFRLYDVVRIDHFRGFDEYYSIPFGDATAENGTWEKGPGIELFRALEKAIGKNEVIAEDLGFVTQSVKQLVADSGFPGMKVLEFAFDDRDTGTTSDYMPHNYPYNAIAYTGTHDNETLVGWWHSIGENAQERVRDYLCDYYTPDDKIYLPLIASVLRSGAKLCMIPLQDYMGLDNSARMNEPSTIGDNWKWRIRNDALDDSLQMTIRKMTQYFDR